jgi:hypothetical protein
MAETPPAQKPALALPEICEDMTAEAETLMPKDAGTHHWGDWEGVPVVYGTFEAWCWDGTKWVDVEPAEVSHKAAVISEAEFRQMFGPLPPLPHGAFRPHLLRDAAAAVYLWLYEHGLVMRKEWRELREFTESLGSKGEAEIVSISEAGRSRRGHAAAAPGTPLVRDRAAPRHSGSDHRRVHAATCFHRVLAASL